MSQTNGTTADQVDAGIDVLYSFWPGTAPAPAPCPEAALSLTVKGLLNGNEAMLTIRGQSAEEFQKNLAAVRGLLDAPQPPQAPATPPSPAARPTQGQDWCQKHAVQMRWNEGKEGRKGWFSHKTGQGWCKGR
jgi:hypothetical protein